MSYPQEFHRVEKRPSGVLHVILNRPKLLNAMHKPAYLEYGKIFQLADEDPDVRVIVLSGEGRAFCAGLDVGGMASEFAPDDDSDQSRVGIKLTRTVKEFQNAISQPYYINKPVIGVAHGACIGLAMDILTAVDIRIASLDSKFSVREIELGMAADIGTLQRLPRLVNNLGWIKDISFSGRDFGPYEAHAQGLVQRVVKTKEDALDAALEYAESLAQKSPVAMLGTKKSINYALDHTHEDSLNQIAEFNGHGLGSDFMTGCMAMLESVQTKRKVVPKYSKL